MSDESNDVLNLGELLGKTTADYPDLPDFPPKKTFYGEITGISAGKSKAKGTPFFFVGVRLTDPGKDVPEAWIADLKKNGFSLADYSTGCNFYLTQGAMKIFRRFLDSIGYPSNVRIDEGLKLNPNTFTPTDETQEILRGRAVICVTKEPGENGRVYSGELDSIAGIKRD